MKIQVFGSCVSRDVLRMVGRDDLLVRYIARTSVVCAVHPPLPRRVTITLASPFRARMVQNDLYKDLVPRLSDPGLVILMDCIDERVDLLATEGTYVTRSEEMVQGGVMEQLGEWAAVDRQSAEGRRLWGESCRTLRERIHPTSRVVLHRAFWAREYIREGGRRRFTGKLEGDIERNNEHLEFCYGEIERWLEPAVVEASPGYVVASSTHRWGLSPFHYVDEYYHDVWEKIEAAGANGGS